MSKTYKLVYTLNIIFSVTQLSIIHDNINSITKC